MLRYTSTVTEPQTRIQQPPGMPPVSKLNSNCPHSQKEDAEYQKMRRDLIIGASVTGGVLLLMIIGVCVMSGMKKKAKK